VAIVAESKAGDNTAERCGMHRSSPLVTRRHVFLVGAAMASVLGSPNAQEAPVGAIDTLRGNAFAEGSLPRRALQQAAEVFVNDLVETEINSSLTMHLGKATFVKLGALAKFRIDRFVVDAGGSFELEQGPLLIDRDESAKSETLQVRSPFALIAARGTMFFAGPSNNVFGVFVSRGLVSVTGGGRTVILRPGLGTNIANPGDAPSEPRRWGPGRITAALKSVS
jgi:FecR protein